VDWGIQIDCTELATITDDRVQTWYRLNWQWANNESTCNNTKVSNVKWISTTILPVYSCCYYYRSLVSIDYPDRRVRDRYLCKLRTDTRYDQSTITSWETYSIKAWEGWDPEGGSRYSASQAITSPDKRSGDFFWFIFCFFGHGRALSCFGRTRDRNKLLTECEEKPKFTTEICYGVEQVCFFVGSLWSGDQYFLTFWGMFVIMWETYESYCFIWVTHASSDWLRV
jgi:hypothetical protein